VTKIYVAGPLFNTHERWYLEQIAAALEAAGYATFLPHRDAGLLDGKDHLTMRHELFQADMAGLRQCNVIVALLTGADHDSGTCGELGIAFERGYPCFGIGDDMRWMNNFIWGICGEGSRIAPDIAGVVELVKRDVPVEG
jgi:nucleoside 2-deoxyribosyltransferase